MFYDPSLVAMLDTLAFLNKLNHKVEGLKVSCEVFHLNELGELLDIRVDYVLWLTDSNVSNPIYSNTNIFNSKKSFRQESSSYAIILSCSTQRLKPKYSKRTNRFR